jgi:hypothetical protein
MTLFSKIFNRDKEKDTSDGKKRKKTKQPLDDLRKREDTGN